MKLFNKILFVTLFFYLLGNAQVDVVIADLKVNGTQITNNTINFGNDLNVNVSFNVKLKTFDGDLNNILGNLNIYTKDLPNNLPTPVGYHAVTFNVLNPPSVPQTTYTNDNLFFYISLSKNDFFNSNGVVFAEYKNNNNNTFKSANITIIGGSKTISTVSNLQEFNNEICCEQFIRYGDKPLLMSGTNIDGSNLTCNWQHNTGNDFETLINYANDEINTFDADYMFESKNVSRLLYRSERSNWKRSNGINITVIPTPINTNIIELPSTLLKDGTTNTYDITSGNRIDITGNRVIVNLNVYDNPYHIKSRRDRFSSVDEYHWEYRSNYYNSKWKVLSNETTEDISNFTPPIDTPRSFQIRRIAKYGGIKRVSNVIIVNIITPVVNNNICCDQFIQNINITPISLLTGGIPEFDPYFVNLGYDVPIISKSYSFIWQVQQRGEWVDIPGATNKDYMPVADAITSNKLYRRKMIWVVRFRNTVNGNVIEERISSIYSNMVLIQISSRRIRKESQITSNSNSIFEDKNFIGINEISKTEQKDIINNDLNIYPNPTNNFVNISNFENIEKVKITLFDLYGKELKVNQTDIDTNSLNLDLSNLSRGNYILCIDDNSEIIYKKIIKE